MTTTKGVLSMTATAADTAPAFRCFVEVGRFGRLSPGLVLITFTGSELGAFADNGFDQRIKVLLPREDGSPPRVPAGPDGYARWCALPEKERTPVRTYTARRVRPGAREVDVDLVVHGDSGPATRWARRARPGERLVLLGPNAAFPGVHGGVEFRPASCAVPLVLAGDETAVPAIASILECLPAHAQGDVLLEVPDALDVLDVVRPRRRTGRRTGGRRRRHHDVVGGASGSCDRRAQRLAGR